MMSTKTATSMFDFTFEKSSILTNALAVICGSLFLVLGAKVAIPLPFTPVPITGQTFSVLVIGSMLGATRAPLAVLLYAAYGIFGLPVFAENSSGAAILWGATGGYILGFVVCAYVTGKLSEKGWDRTMVKSLISMTIGQFFIFALGLLWLIPYVGANQVLEKGLYPFILGGVVKTLLAATTSSLGWTLLEKIKGAKHG